MKVQLIKHLYRVVCNKHYLQFDLNSLLGSANFNLPDNNTSNGLHMKSGSQSHSSSGMVLKPMIQSTQFSWPFKSQVC